MMKDISDWRFTNQIEYLYKVKLIKVDYILKSTEWDHDHCEFCWIKFDSVEQKGYCTIDRYHWICEDCFNDFKKNFQWQVLNKQ